MSDGSIIIDTKLDSSGIEKGMKNTETSVKAQVSKLASEYKKQGMSASEAFKKAWEEIERDSKTKSEETANNWKNSTSKLSGIASSSLKVLTGVVLGASTALATAGAMAIKTGMDFEAQMSRVKAISGATNEEFKQLNDQALQLGADTSFSAKQAAEGMENLASAGFSTGEIMKAMPGLLDLAASSGEDLASSSDIAASTLRGFNLAASDAGHVADVLAKNAAATNAAVSDTGEAMKYIAPVANTVGWSVESVTAARGEMAKSGIKGSQAGTTLRGAISRLADPSKEAANAMKKIGFTAYDSAGKMLPLDQVIGNLQKSTEGLTDKQKQQAISTIFGQEAMSGMMVLLSQGQGSLQDLTNQYKNCDGAANEMAKTMKDNLKGAIDEFKGSAETLGITVFQSVDSPLKDITKSATGMINGLTDSFKNGGFEGLISSLGGVFSQVVTNMTSQAPNFINMGVQLIQNLISGLQNNLPQIASSAMQIISALANGFITLLPQILELGLQLLMQLGQGILQALPNLIPTIIQLITSFSQFITENIATIVQLGIQLLLALVQGLMNALPQLVVLIPQVINSFCEALFGQLPAIIMAGVQILMMLIKGIVQAIPTLISNIPQIILAIVNVISLFSWASLGKGLITKIGEGLSSMKSNIGNIAKGIADWIGTTIKNIFTGGLTWGKNLISSIGNGISSLGGFLADSAKTVGSSALDAVGNTFRGAVDIGKNLISGIWEGIGNMKDWILDKIGGFAGSIVSSIKDFFGIHSPSRLMRDLIGTNIVKGIGVGIEVETPNLKKDVNDNMRDLVAKMKATVGYETSKTTFGVISKGEYKASKNNPHSVTNNENGVTQNITITQPVKSPSETARAIRKVGRDLVFG